MNKHNPLLYFYHPESLLSGAHLPQVFPRAVIISYPLGSFPHAQLRVAPAAFLLCIAATNRSATSVLEIEYIGCDFSKGVGFPSHSSSFRVTHGEKARSVWKEGVAKSNAGKIGHQGHISTGRCDSHDGEEERRKSRWCHGGHISTHSAPLRSVRIRLDGAIAFHFPCLFAMRQKIATIVSSSNDSCITTLTRDASAGRGLSVSEPGRTTV